MKIFKKIASEINILTGKVIYKSHSGFIKCTVDLFYLTMNGCIFKNFNIKQGHCETKKIEKYEYVGEGFTKTKVFDEIPSFMMGIIREEKTSIQNYLGKNFLAEKVVSYVNLQLPSWALNYDVYSNIWHMDSHDGLRLLKIFVNLEDTSDEDGPLFYMNRKDTKRNFILFWNRWTFDNVRKNEPSSINNEKKFTSIKGGYLIMDTGNCYHRASSPIKGGSRKFLQITLYPKWRKNKDRFLIEC
jgi:hypothetical protein